MTKRLLLGAVLLGLAAAGSAQSLDDLNIQFHGYVTQSFIYSDVNSWNTTDSENGSFAWNEAVLNLSGQPEARLHIGVQARFFLLGDQGNKITLDYASADYKVNDRLGVRFGKVKTPIGLFNESQDVDPAQLWVLLPQSMYPIWSRNTILSHYGGVVYGSLPLGEGFGKLEYRGFAGGRTVAGDDGYFQSLRDEGFNLPNGVTGKAAGGTLQWRTPIRGLMAGASESSGLVSGEMDYGADPGTLSLKQFRQTYTFAKLERGRVMLAAEYSRFQAAGVIQLLGVPPSLPKTDQRPWYVMASYKLTSKLSGGVYYSSVVEHADPYSSATYEKDWTVAARYDFTPFLYAKAEQHWMDGTLVGFAAGDNPNLAPGTRLTLLKAGVSF